MATTSGLSWLSGRDIRLIALNIGDKEITDPAIEVSLAFLAEFCPKASVALLSNRDDEAATPAAMQRGVRDFFPTSIPVEVAIAGLRLVLAGRNLPAPTDVQGASRFIRIGTPRQCPSPRNPRGQRRQQGHAGEAVSDLTPREQHVLEELQLGLPTS